MISFASRCRLRFALTTRWFSIFWGIWVNRVQNQGLEEAITFEVKTEYSQDCKVFFYPLLGVPKSAALGCLTGAEKMMLMGFPLDAIDVGSVSDRVTLACLSFHKQKNTAPNQTLITLDACDTPKALGQMAGNAMHLRAVGAALCCLMKAC